MGIWTTQRGYTILHEITQGYYRLHRAKLGFLNATQGCTCHMGLVTGLHLLGLQKVTLAWIHRVTYLQAQPSHSSQVG